MPAVSACPSPELLQLLAAGRLSPEESAPFEAHLADCRDCVARLASWEASTGAHRCTLPIADDEDRRILAHVTARAIAAVSDTSARRADTSAVGHTGDVGESDPRDADVATLLGLFDPPGQRELAGALGAFAGYRIVRLLGCGGMGIVFEAEDPRLGRHVALKLVRPSVAKDPAWRARLRHEAQAVAALACDHVVGIFDVGEDKGIPYLAMPLLAGETLEARLQSLGSCDVVAALEIGRQAAVGLAAIHDAGFVHRDLKPGNIWLERGSDRVKILDFGIAVGGSAEQLATEEYIFGTLHYMSPEQMDSQEIDARSDLYALGAILYHTLAGRTPYAGQTPAELFAQTQTTAPRPLDQMQAGIPADVARFVEQLLAHDRADRPASARDVVAQIESLQQTLGAKKNAPAALAATKPSSDRAAASPWLWLAGGLLGLAAIAWGIVVLLSTPKGTLKIEAAEGVKIEAGDQVAVVRNVADGVEYKLYFGENQLRPGVYAIVVEEVRRGIRFETPEVEILQGKERKLRATAVPNPVPPPAVAVAPPAPASQMLGPPPMLPAGFALEFDGRKSRVDIPNPRLGISKPYTVEAWVCYDGPAVKEDSQSILAGSGMRLRREGGDRCRFYCVQVGGPGFTAQSDRTLPKRDWVHIAAVYDGRARRLFLNGKPQERAGGEGESPENSTRFVLGAAVRSVQASAYEMHFCGYLREIRFSDVARYDREFAPTPRFTPDAQTLGLYHCDEGQGPELRDSSGRGHHGSIVAARWAKVAPPGPQ